MAMMMRAVANVVRMKNGLIVLVLLVLAVMTRYTYLPVAGDARVDHWSGQIEIWGCEKQEVWRKVDRSWLLLPVSVCRWR